MLDFDILVEIIPFAFSSIALFIAIFKFKQELKVVGPVFKIPESILKAKIGKFSITEPEKQLSPKITISVEQIIHNIGDRKSFLRITDVKLYLSGKAYITITEPSGLFSRFFDIDYHESTKFIFVLSEDELNINNMGLTGNTEIHIKYRYYNHKDKWINSVFIIPATILDKATKEILDIE